MRLRHFRSTHLRSGGFTLVEILIVVAILGIIAAIVTPKFVDATDEARESAITAQLRILRGQIQLYKQKQGAVPDMSSWNALVSGGFLPAPAVNPLNENTAIAGAPGAGVGWVWRKVTPTSSSFNLYATDETALAESPE